ncbi:MAG: LysR family transcriptional regulator [Thermodesulfobacteriota bacterium]
MKMPDVERLLRNASLRQLHIFVTVVRLESFSRAAEALHVTQPTVSMQVRKLAEAVGHPLVEHVGKGFHLTAAGRVVHACCASVFTALSEMHMTLADMAGLKQGRLRLAVVTTAEYFAPRVLGDFSRRYPGVEVELLVVNRGQVMARFARNLDDLYVIGTPPEGMPAVATPFLENPQVPVAARDHPLARERAIPFARFAREPMIMREKGSGTRKTVEALFRAAGLAPLVRMEFGGNEAIKQAVAGGLGVSILSRHALAMPGEASPVAVLDVEGFPVQRRWHLVYPVGKELSPVAKAFRRYLLEEAGPRI